VQWLTMKEGITVESVTLKRHWPRTLLVVTFEHEQLPGCRIAWHQPIWRSALQHLEPKYDEFLQVHLSEYVGKNLGRWRDCRPGETRDVGILQLY